MHLVILTGLIALSFVSGQTSEDVVPSIARSLSSNADIWLGSQLCLGAAFLANTAGFYNVPDRSLTIPHDCLPQPGTDATKCKALNVLWETKFYYCCPIAYLDNVTSGAGYLTTPQLTDKSDPKALANPKKLISSLPAGVFFAKWVGMPGGCRLIWDCNALNKQQCNARGPLCVWQRTVCVESLTQLATIFCSGGNCPTVGIDICFPGDSTVKMEDGTVKRMDELRLGDSILSAVAATGELRFSPIKWFLHVDRNANETFVHISHEHGIVTLSPNHLLFVSKAETQGLGGLPMEIIAAQVREGDYVWSHKSNALVASQVTMVETVTRRGIYAPVTEEGTLVVDGTLASAFVGVPVDRSGNNEGRSVFFSGQHAKGAWICRVLSSLFTMLTAPEVSRDYNMLKAGELPGQVRTGESAVQFWMWLQQTWL